MSKTYHIRWLVGCLVFAWTAESVLLGSAVATAVPYPLPPGYLSSYDQGYNAMAPKMGSKYFLGFLDDPHPLCYDELRIAQSTNPPENADGFVVGCLDAAQHALGIYNPCDRNGDDPVCPRRP